jgi:hypothetical protein
MNKLVSALAAVATVATVVPAAMAVPQAANAAVRVVVGGPGVGFFYGGRHFRHRVWRDGAWFYTDPFVMGAPYGYGYAPAYGYGYAPAYGYGGAYYGGGYGYRRAPVYYGGRYGRAHYGNGGRNYVNGGYNTGGHHRH